MTDEPDHDELVELLEDLLFLEARLHREQVEQLKQALHTNRRIGMATGILMAQHRMTADQAFAALKRVSRDGNHKLRDVAAFVVRTGDLPAEQDRPGTSRTSCPARPDGIATRSGSSAEP